MPSVAVVVLALLAGVEAATAYLLFHAEKRILVQEAVNLDHEARLERIDHAIILALAELQATDEPVG